MILQKVFITLLISVSSLAFTSMACANQSCEGVINGNIISVPYPFGFSIDCKIQLNCSENGDISIGEYIIKNMTSDHILVNLPAKCNRSFDDMGKFYSDHYALTSRNSLLLYNCTGSASNCMIPATTILRPKLGFEGCDQVISSFDNITCFSDDGVSKFLEYEQMRNDCSVLLTSVVVDLENYKLNRSTVLEVEPETVELGWWLVGDCGCHADAVCTNFSVPNGGMGYRCRCNEGFIGDGFADGGGCRKDDCSAPNYISEGCGGTTNVGILIGGIIGGALLVAAAGVIWYCFHKRSRTLKNQISAKHLLSEATGNSNVPFIPYKEIERATSGFAEKERLGTGAYGTVYAGKLYNDEWVAVKKIKHRDHESIHQVMNEIKLLSTVSHPNLVRLLGCCIENGEQILVYEFMPNGTLAQHLQRERGPGLPWTVRLTIAADTAHAIAHLHTATNPPIYHRDIKSSNILLDHNFNTKVADFGLSRFGMMDDSHISTAPQGTPGYVDPQYHQNYHLSDKSDVYSFGVVLVEIITALKVVDFSRSHTEINLSALAIDRIGKGRVDEIIDPFLEPHRDAWTLSSIHRVAELAFRCLAFHRDMRPSMTEVADELEQIKLSGWAPMEDNIGMASSVASTCSSPYAVSEISLSSTITKKAAIGSRRSVISNKVGDSLPSTEELKDTSPVSVQDPWLSEESSPSSNSLLGNLVR